VSGGQWADRVKASFSSPASCYCLLQLILVPAAGVEPATFRSGGERSNPLSYAGIDVCRKDNTATNGLLMREKQDKHGNKSLI
jgi:hypothetical protein